MTEKSACLTRIDLDEATLASTTSDIDYERKVAIHDILASNTFRPVGTEMGQGPFTLHLSEQNGRLVFAVGCEPDGSDIATHQISMAPFRRLIKDYFMLFESYYEAIKAAQPEKLETIDMARRAVHNEGSETLQSVLKGKIDTDFDTSRRLFTLICSIAMRATHAGAGR